ncbi:MAG: GNAT family N-acetyltransferase [Candidatus Thorarchaeota archaeon]|jgi:ribosomal protein S18 acetylase RimI-like enzyme
MDETILRLASIDDLQSIVELWIESSQYHAELEPRFQYSLEVSQPTEKYYSKLIQSEEAYVAVAQYDQQITGFISALINERPPIHLHRKMGFIDGLFVKPKVRRQGIGTGLWHMTLDWLKQQKVDKIQLTVAAMNPEAIEFWRKRGFSELILRLELDSI